MKDKFPMRTAGREMRRKERLNSTDPHCLLCTLGNWVRLIPVALHRLVERGIPSILFEEHHVVGVAHDPKLTVTLCRNCHALATEDLRRSDVSMKPALDRRTLTALRLEGLATFLERVALSIREWISDLTNGGRIDD